MFFFQALILYEFNLFYGKGVPGDPVFCPHHWITRTFAYQLAQLILFQLVFEPLGLEYGLQSSPTDEARRKEDASALRVLHHQLDWIEGRRLRLLRSIRKKI